MKPLSPEALKQLALRRGAKFEMNGVPYNSSRRQKAFQPIAEPPPTPAPTPAPAAEPARDARMEALLKINLTLLEAVRAKLAEPAVAPPARPCKWIFTFTRDEKTGLINSPIEANAQ